MSVPTPDDGRRVVDSLAAGGADFIKVYDGLSRDVYFAVVARARERGLRVAGHVPGSVSPVEASDAGMWSIEHVTVAPACIPGLERIAREANAAASRPGVSPDSVLAIRLQTDGRVIAAFDEAACTDAGAVLARNHTWLVPTLARERTWSRAYLASSAAGSDPQLRYVPGSVRANWNRWRDSILAARTPAEAMTEPDRYRLYVRIVAALRAAGVGVLPGTDTDGSDAFFYGVPGSTLHAELATLVGDVGFTPAEALRAATAEAARFLGVADSLGSVESGKLAELVLLDANPLADVRNLRRIRAVVRGGRLLDRAALDALLAERARAIAAADSGHTPGSQ